MQVLKIVTPAKPGAVLEFPIFVVIIAELQRAKRASEAPWVRKIGNPSSRENLVMTSAYDRASERTSVNTRGEGEGRLETFLTECHLSLAGFCLEKSFLFAMSTNDRSG